MSPSPVSREKYRRLVELESEAARLRAELEAPDGSVRYAPYTSEDPEVWNLLARYGSDFLSLHTASGGYRYASPSVQGLFGWRPEALVGTSAYDYFHPDDADQIAQNHVAHGHGEPVDAVVYRFRCADGGYRWVETRSKAVRGEAGVRFIVCITRDVEEQRNADVARDALTAELRRRLDEIRTLRGLLPMCAWCKSVRDDQGYWGSVERYLSRHEDLQLTHSICPACEERHDPEGDG